MKILEEVELSVLQQHEAATNANARLGGYRMDRCSPIHEFILYRATLQSADDDRLFFLGEFAKYTVGKTGRVRDIDVSLLDDRSRARIDSFVAPATGNGFARVDLRSSPHLALVVVAANTDTAGLVMIDGNHRTIAQHLQFGTLCDVPVFLCVHERIGEWPFIPAAARHLHE